MRGRAGRVALVTGGTRGIGLGIARALAAEGFALALNGVRPEAGVREVLEELGGRTEVLYCRGDVSTAEARTAVLGRVREAFGALHLLVNNAGVAPKERRDLLEATEESFDHVLGINLRGPYFLTQAAARWMVEQKQADAGFAGAIINIGSVSATLASVNRGEYCVAKAGLGMMTALFAARLGEHGIPVYEVRPGVVHTDMSAPAREKYDRMLREGLCVTPRWGEPEDVGRAVAALARGDFAYSTGQVVMVDGGMTLGRL
jgi:3-oxoacyl-[acyl-carrier protein] reductase